MRDVALMVGHLAANIPDSPQHPTDYMAMLAGVARDGGARVWEITQSLMGPAEVEQAMAELLWDLALIHSGAYLGAQPNPDESNPLVSGGWCYGAIGFIGRAMPAKYGHVWETQEGGDDASG